MLIVASAAEAVVVVAAFPFKIEYNTNGNAHRVVADCIWWRRYCIRISTDKFSKMIKSYVRRAHTRNEM